MEGMLCISCRTNISSVPDSIRFKCPNCGKSEIIRCGKCRKLGIVYKCPDCNFEGP